jgi:predicted kinase
MNNVNTIITQRLQPIFNENVPVLFVMIGVPGSGKSTFTEKLISAYPGSWHIASTDAMIDKLAEEQQSTYSDIFKTVNFKQLQKTMQANMQDAFSQKQHVVFDRTNMGKKSRKIAFDLLDEAKVFKDYARVALDFTIDEKVLKERLQARGKATGKWIPESVIKSMFDNYQPPSKEEGFTYIFSVHNS